MLIKYELKIDIFLKKFLLNTKIIYGYSYLLLYVIHSLKHLYCKADHDLSKFLKFR
jgi:hypothetical protein